MAFREDTALRDQIEDADFSGRLGPVDVIPLNDSAVELRKPKVLYEGRVASEYGIIRVPLTEWLDPTGQKDMNGTTFVGSRPGSMYVRSTQRVSYVLILEAWLEGSVKGGMSYSVQGFLLLGIHYPKTQQYRRAMWVGLQTTQALSYSKVAGLYTRVLALFFYMSSVLP